jgi:2-succinyl-6-hydroxy-2,4-cyclohexadiene-1-carboxylate synthase
VTKYRTNRVDINLEKVGDGPALVLLHGFTGSAATWREHSQIFAQDHLVIAVDALGHGLSDSPADPTRYTFPQLAADFVALLDELGIEQTALLGYSMGGRMALYLALTAPERISKLVLESASPGLASEADRQVRAESDNALAGRIEREGIEAFVNYWEKLPLWQSQSQLSEAVRASQHAQRLHNNPRGLANSLRGAGTGVQPSLWDRLGELKIPTLLVAGEHDPKFCAIARQMQEKIPQARLEIVSGAGHAVHLERPDEFDNLVKDFLAIGC